MPQSINCPSCTRLLRVPENLLGKPVKCPACGTNFNVAVGAEPSDYDSASVPPPEQDPDANYVDSPAEDSLDDRRSSRGRRRRSRRGRGGAPHRGPLILVLSIIGLVMLMFCAVLTLPFCLPAWLMANRDLRLMRAGQMDDEGEGLTQAGRICGIIGTILGGLVFLALCLYVLVIIVAIGMGGPPR